MLRVIKNVTIDMPNVNDVSNAGFSVHEVTLSTPEDACNRIKKTLTGFEKEHFPPNNVIPQRLCPAYFSATEDLKFRDVLSAIIN